MSSIAYITDNNMLEFHRIHGHKTMNFWRFDSKQFSDFTEGDLLFFLVKKSERPNSSEKGILGCGRLEWNHTISIKKMWENYGELNGYGSYEELREAIRKMAKDSKMPRSMNCLFLNDVIYFNEPLYLSDFGIQISNYIESYIYLNKNDSEIENKLLEQARKNGIDIWSSVLSDSNDTVFDEQLIINRINEIHKEIGDLTYNSKKTRLLLREARRFKEENREFTAFKNSQTEFYKVDKNTVTVLLINVADQVNSDDYKKMIGHMFLYRKMCRECDFNLKFVIKNDSGDSLLGYLGE